MLPRVGHMMVPVFFGAVVRPAFKLMLPSQNKSFDFFVHVSIKPKNLSSSRRNLCRSLHVSLEGYVLAPSLEKIVSDKDFSYFILLGETNLT